MVFSDTNNNISTAGMTGLNFVGKEYAGNRKKLSGIKIPKIADSFHRRKNASNDGKFSFLELGKNILKGTGQFFTDIVKNIKEHPLISAATLALFGAMACTPAGLMILSGMGLAGSIFGLAFLGFKSAKLVNNGKWDELEKKGKDLGKLIPATIISAFGAVKGTKMLTGASAKVSTSMKKALELDARVSWAFIKNLALTPYRAAKSMVKTPKNFRHEILRPHRFFTVGMKRDYGKAVNNLNKNLFSTAEKDFLKDAKVFDWRFGAFRNLDKAKDSSPMALKELGDA